MKIKNVKLTLIIFTGLVFAGFAFFTTAQENSSSDKNIFLDSDQDGLSNEEEITYGTDPENSDTDRDGYSDGAEVKSGYNPLVPAPGDKIINPKQLVTESPETENENSKEDRNDEDKAGDKNLTDEVSIKIAELVSNPDPESQEITMEDIEALIQETMGSEIAFEDLPEIDEDEIKIKKQNYSSLSEEKREAKEKEDELEYLTAISYIAVNNLPYKITEAEDLEKFMQEIITQVSLFSTNLSDISYFENLADRGEEALEQLNEVGVPENFLDLHIKGLQLMKYAVSLRDEARLDPQDPISTIADISKVQSLIVLSMNFLEEISSETKSLDILEISL